MSSNSLFSSQHFNKQVFWNLNAIINIWYGLEFASALRLQQSSRNMAQKLLLFSIISVLILQCYSGIFGYNQLKSVNFINKLNRILDLAKLFSSSFEKKGARFSTTSSDSVDREILDLSERLFDASTNIFNQVRVNLQSRTRSSDVRDDAPAQYEFRAMFHSSDFNLSHFNTVFWMSVSPLWMEYRQLLKCERFSITMKWMRHCART